MEDFRLISGAATFSEGHFEEVRQAWVEDLQVPRAGDAVSLVLEGEQLVGDAEFTQNLRDGLDVIRGDVRVLEALHDKEPPPDVLHEVYRGARMVALRD